MGRVFVYGTLMRAGANQPVLVRLGATFVAEACTAAPRTLVDLGPYPALLPCDWPSTERMTVFGEVFDVPEDRMPELDAFEGTPHLYRRERIAVRIGDRTETVSTYVLARRPPKTALAIATGRYALPGTPLPEGASPTQLDPDD